MSEASGSGETAQEDDVSQAPSYYPRGAIILVSLAAATVTAIGLAGIRGILAPVLLTLVLSICAHPVRRELERRGVPHGLATGAVMLSIALLLVAFFVILIIATSQFVAMLPNYSKQLQSIGTNFANWLTSIGIGDAQVKAIVAGFDPKSLISFFSGLLGSVFSITGALVIIFTMLILMSADAVYVPTILRQLQPRRPYFVSAISEFAVSVRRYMVVTTILGITQGVINAFALWIMHVPAALLWGVLAFLCSFIPNVGYFIAIIPPIVFGFFVGGWPTVIAVIIVYGLINAVIQSIIQPRVVGNAVSLSQTITFFSVLFWAVILGPIGAVLAIPLTLLVRAILVDANPRARWWRPALGDTTQTRELMKTGDAVAKQERAERRALPKPPKSSRSSDGGKK
jgi:predicted PurR-regulated permease PerM